MIKGVNLGGWFVLESWMKPELFHKLDTKDETGFVTLNKHAKRDLEKHWHTFITKEDFVYLKRLGVQALRIPIPWWFEGDSPYVASIPYIHQAMKWASELNLDVLLDLHTAPGCQNGFDHGGIEGVMTWHMFQKNIDLTLETLLKIVKTFKDYPSFMGIEVLNEPFATISLDIIQTFYKKAYDILRQETDKLIVFHDAFRPDDASWISFFKDHHMQHVVFDMHLYHCFDSRLTEGSFDDHISLIINERIPLIKQIQTFVPVIIGEWSLGINYEFMRKNPTFNERLYAKLLANLQLYAYKETYGHFFWSYKIDRDSHIYWDFKRLIKEGILPDPY